MSSPSLAVLRSDLVNRRAAEIQRLLTDRAFLQSSRCNSAGRYREQEGWGSCPVYRWKHRKLNSPKSEQINFSFGVYNLNLLKKLTYQNFKAWFLRHTHKIYIYPVFIMHKKRFQCEIWLGTNANWEKCQLGMMRLRQRSCLQDDGWSWFDLQNPSIPKRIKGRVRIVRERSSIEGEEGGHVVEDEAELIRVNSTLWSLAFGVDDAGSQARHHRVIHHHTNLQRNIQTLCSGSSIT